MRRLLRLLSLVVLVVPFLLPPTSSAEATRLVRWGYYVKGNANSLTSLRAHAANLDYVSPDYFAMQADGDIEGHDLPDISALVKQSGAKLVPMIQNKERYGAFSPVLNDPATRRKAVTGLASIVLAYNYDGIHIDFEALEPGDRAGLNQFMADLAAALRPKGKLTTIALGAKTEDKTTGWAGVYDYAALGRHADLVVLMAYAYRTSQAGEPGSTSPYGWVQSAAQFAVSQIPPGKVLLGVALWGYDWNVTAGGPAVTRTYNETMGLMALWGGNAGFHDNDRSAWLEYFNASQRHVVWYEDCRSLEAKIKIAVDKGMAGFAGWRLGHEGDEAWRLFNSYSRGNTPLDWDIPGGHYFTQATGYPPGVSLKGYSITNESGAKFWDEFKRLGGVAGAGYPLSRRFMWDGFITQVMQKGIFQWRPEANRVYFINIFDELHDSGYDDWLLSYRSTPRPMDGSFDAGKNWDQIMRDRLALLDANPAIKAKYWAVSDPVFQYGLPVSRVVDNGNHYAIRLQRAVMQQWKVETPWSRAGQVTVANGGSVAVEANMFSPDLTAPDYPP